MIGSKTTACLLIVFFQLSLSSPSLAQVNPACVSRFANGGAVPGSSMCFDLAITSPASLANFFCGIEEAEEYCGGTPPECGSGELPDFDTGECIQIQCPDGSQPDEDGMCPMQEDLCPDGSQPDVDGMCPMDEDLCPDGSQRVDGMCTTDELCPDGSEPLANGVCPVLDENRDTDGTCLYGLPDFNTGLCPEMPTLDNFDDLAESGADENGCRSDTAGNPLPTLSGPLATVLGGLGSFIDRIAAITILNSTAVGINLADSAVEADETGDPGRLFDNVYDLVLPFFPGDNSIQDAFSDFSSLIALSNGCR